MDKKVITDFSALQSTIKKEKAALAYFYNDDCPPCISLRPKVENLINSEFPEMKISWVNSKNNPEIPAHFGIFANPTILIFFEDKEFKRFSKYMSIAELSKSINRYYNMIFSGSYSQYFLALIRIIILNFIR
ncbi:MAG: thioredoxin family protein [Bacteroidales bacterium]|nr:thioredoxin family protein [Bacteroidales bacterium]